MHKSTSGAHLVCAWAWAWVLHVQRPFLELNASFCASLGVQLWFWILFWRWTPDLGRRLALNASLRRQFLVKVWTIIDIAGKTWISTFQRNWKHAISSSVAPENPLWVQGGQNPTASAVLFQPELDFCSAPSISARKIPEITEKHTTHSKVQKYEFFLKTTENKLKTN